MTHVHLRGRLICHSASHAAIVTAHLPRHIELTRAEPGCLSFTVEPTEDPRVWSVDEVFLDAAAFQKHQERARTSEWGLATAHIERDYVVHGL